VQFQAHMTYEIVYNSKTLLNKFSSKIRACATSVLIEAHQIYPSSFKTPQLTCTAAEQTESAPMHPFQVRKSTKARATVAGQLPPGNTLSASLIYSQRNTKHLKPKEINIEHTVSQSHAKRKHTDRSK